MIEIELKAVVPDLDLLLERLARGNARETFVGRLEDRRFDTSDAALGARGETLRVRVYRAPGETPATSLDWKGPVMLVDGYKQREELTAGAIDPDALMTILAKLGYELRSSIDREIWQYDLDGACIRIERYPRMDVLVEVEGAPAAIESAIAALGIPRIEFTGESLAAFASRFEGRTGAVARLSGTFDPIPGPASRESLIKARSSTRRP